MRTYFVTAIIQGIENTYVIPSSSEVMAVNYIYKKFFDVDANEIEIVSVTL
jgi:hypothetical protein